MTGLYIHVPFCRSKCGYCDFYSRVRQDQMALYLQALSAELESWRGKGVLADSLFFGGGTPSLLPAEEVASLIECCRSVFALEGEITLEANPDTVTPESLLQFRQAGVNRLSFGVQSAVERELKALGRRHTFARAAEAVSWARQAGFENISLDLMLGIPYQTVGTLGETLDAMLALRPEHLSCYLLKIEKGTPFAHRQMERYCADGDEAAGLYLQTCQQLRQAGYQHYEISNFCLPGFESRHNLKYWRCEDYLGFGPAAHSCFGGKRFYHPADLSRYLSGEAPIEDGPAGDDSERIMLGLRLAEGISAGDLTPAFDWAGLCKKCLPYIKAGLMAQTGDRLFLTEEGFLVSNSLLSEIL